MNEEKKELKTFDKMLEDLKDESIHQKIEKITPIKEWLVTYVGNKVKPENMEVDVNMIVNVLAEEFPEFLLVIAEENFFRGYNQALTDMQERVKAKKENKNE